MYNILILGMGGEVSKGILKAIRHSAIPCHIVGACISLNSEGLYQCDKAYVSPYASDPEFIPWLIEICNREEICMVLTGVEENIWAISKGLEQLRKETKTIFRVSEIPQLEVGGDKLKTCLWLREHGFSYPRFAAAENKEEADRLLSGVGFPLIAKPRNGKGSSGIFIIENTQELKTVLQYRNYVLEECVGTPEEEYTVGCYYGLNGELPEPIVMRRQLKHGSSWKVEVVRNPKISEFARALCAEFRPNGPLNIQLRLNEEGEPVPFELNVRFSGTTPMRAHFGFCDVQAMLYESLLHRKIENCFSVRPGIAYRYTEELYLAEQPERLPGDEVIWKSLI